MVVGVEVQEVQRHVDAPIPRRVDVRHRVDEPAAVAPADHVVVGDVHAGAAPSADVEELVDG